MDYSAIISTFFIGFSTAFFAIFSCHILLWRNNRSRFQTVLGWIMAVWALWNLKDIIITFPNLYSRKVLDWIMIIDGWSALTYTIFVFEVTMPGWTTWRRMTLLSVPFLVFTIAYGANFPSHEAVLTAYIVFLWFYAWSIVIIAYVKARRHIRYVQNNFSNIENIDVSWLKAVLLFAISSQLLWLFTSLYMSVLADIFYYVTTLILWLTVLRYSWNFKPIVVEHDEAIGTEQKYVMPFEEGELERVVEQQQLYMNPDLMLSDLARIMCTNRTYLSHYLSHVRQQTYYDFINQLRIEKQAIPLLQSHPEYTFEHVAKKSGFSSMSTFRRAFVKFTGKTPSEYIHTA